MEDDARDRREHRLHERGQPLVRLVRRFDGRNVLRAAAGELRACEALVARHLRRRPGLLRQLLGRVTEAVQEPGVLAQNQREGDEDDGVEALHDRIVIPTQVGIHLFRT